MLSLQNGMPLRQLQPHHHEHENEEGRYARERLGPETGAAEMDEQGADRLLEIKLGQWPLEPVIALSTTNTIEEKRLPKPGTTLALRAR